MTVEWGKYQDAYKAIWQKLDALTKALESIAQDSLKTFSVLRTAAGVSYDARQIRALTSSDMVGCLQLGTWTYNRNWSLDASDIPDLMDRAGRLLGIVYGDVGQLLQRPTTRDLLVQLRHGGTEIDPRDISKTRTYIDFSLSTSGEIIAAPEAGYKLRLFDVFWSSNADIITSLRFGSTGTDMWTLQKMGVNSKNLVGRERDGPPNTNLYGYLSGTGTMKGTIGYEVVPV